MAGIWVVVLLTNLSYSLLGIRLPLGGSFYIFSAVTLFVFAIGYFGFKQTDIFVYEKGQALSSEPTQERYAKSGLKTESAEKMVQRLAKFMETERPYLEPRLTLSDLAESLGLSTHHLSQLLNEHLNQNFFDFVNGYRVAAFKAAVQSPSSQHLTLIAIAQDSGFNSKSSFNRIFKEISGQTPSQYLASLTIMD
jgi:AraC-like DNA-binding protein